MQIGGQVGRVTKVLLNEVDGLVPTKPISDLEAAKRAAEKLKTELDGAIIAVATGGTEGIIREISSRLEKPILIWANPSHNSLPSALEACSILKRNKLPVKLFYSPLHRDHVPRVASFARVAGAIGRLERSKLGIIGGPSSWILTGNEKSAQNVGVELVHMGMEKLLDHVAKADRADVGKIVERVRKSFGAVERSEADVSNAARVYLAMKRLSRENELSAITVRCFDMIPHNLTACLGVSFCNDEGLVAGCEGDLESTLTMMAVSYLTDAPCWMANPVRIDEAENTVTLAHCTITAKMIDLARASIVDHFESGKCVGIRGPTELGDVTLVRWGDRLNKMTIAPGEIVRSDMRDPELCRTQVEVRLKGEVGEFIEKSLGNHQILAYGNLKSLIKDFCEFKGIEAITI